MYTHTHIPHTHTHSHTRSCTYADTYIYLHTHKAHTKHTQSTHTYTLKTHTQLHLHLHLHLHTHTQSTHTYTLTPTHTRTHSYKQMQCNGTSKRDLNLIGGYVNSVPIRDPHSLDERADKPLHSDIHWNSVLVSLAPQSRNFHSSTLKYFAAPGESSWCVPPGREHLSGRGIHGLGLKGWYFAIVRKIQLYIQ